MIIYDTYRSELSFGVERDVLVLKLEQYFDDQLEFEQVLKKMKKPQSTPRKSKPGVEKTERLRLD